MAAVQKCGMTLHYASDEMKTKVNAIMMEFECDVEMAARALATSTVLQLFAKYVDDGHAEAEIVVTCVTLGGNVVANVMLKPDCHSRDLRQRISTSLGVPLPVLRLVLQSGELLRDHKQKPVSELFMLSAAGSSSPAHALSQPHHPTILHGTRLCLCTAFRCFQRRH